MTSSFKKLETTSSKNSRRNTPKNESKRVLPKLEIENTIDETLYDDTSPVGMLIFQFIFLTNR